MDKINCVNISYGKKEIDEFIYNHPLYILSQKNPKLVNQLIQHNKATEFSEILKREDPCEILLYLDKFNDKYIIKKPKNKPIYESDIYKQAIKK